MRDFRGKTAFITGGASGVGLGQAQVFAEAGARIVIADIRQEHLEQAAEWFRERRLPVHALHLDVTDRAAFAAAADAAESVFGPVELLFNTAGVAAFGALEKATYSDYDWIMGVNFGGVVNGIQTFVPRMIAHGRGGHIVNTASTAALQGTDAGGIYSASKFAVRGLSEGLHSALAKYRIGVSILCPANVNTNIADCAATRPKQFADGYTVGKGMLAALRRLHSQGMDAVLLARHLKSAIERDLLYVIPYPEERESIVSHFESILAAIPPPDSDPEGSARRRAAAESFMRQMPPPLNRG